MADAYRVACDVCGKLRAGAMTPCPRCGLLVCQRCEYAQAGVGHEAAEHGNEIRHALGGDIEWNSDDEERDR